MNRPNLGRRRYLQIRRGADAAAAGAGLILLSPVLLGIGIAVRVRMGRPVIFTQERVTRGERIFRLRKFRTMLDEDPACGLVTDEERLTDLGAWLRATSLDELPSLWNILVGDMSVIGPRPLTPDYLPLFGPEQRRRHTVRAGLTGLAQVSGRNGLSWDARFDLDQEYVAHLGLRMDLSILRRTILAVLRREGITEDGEATMSDFPGPMSSPRLRLECSQREGVWAVATPDGAHVFRGELMVLGDGSGRIRFGLTSTDSVDDEMVVEALSLLLSRIRAEGVTRVTTDVPDSGVLRESFRRNGFAPSESDDRSWVAAIGIDDYAPSDRVPEPRSSQR